MKLLILIKRYIIRLFVKSRDCRNLDANLIEIISKSSKFDNLLINVPSESCVSGYYMNIKDDPLVNSLVNEDDFQTLKQFYKNFTPSSVNELLGVSLKSEYGKLSPLKVVLPWEKQEPERKYQQRKTTSLRENSEYGLKHLTLDEGGHTDFGPLSDEKLELEITRIDKIFKSVKNNGFIFESNSKSGIKGYILLNNDGNWRFYITAGKHRAKVLSALGYKQIPVEVRGKEIINIKQSNKWTHVMSGLYSSSEAEYIFKSFFN